MKYTVKEGKITWEYELCDCSGSSGNKYLKITKFHKGILDSEDKVELSEINPEFFEVQAPASKISRMRNPVYCIGGLLYLSSLIIMLSLLSWRHTLCVIVVWLAPLFFGWKIVHFGVPDKKSYFYFGEQDFPCMEIPYGKNRSDALQFVQAIASCCNSKMNAPLQLPVIRHEFANGLAELRDTEIVLFNNKGIKYLGCNYDWLLPKIYHVVEKHTVRNVFCFALPMILWIATLTFILVVAIASKDLMLTLSFGLFAFIPFILGCYLWTLRKKSQDYYHAKFKDDELLSDLGIWHTFKMHLIVGKDPGSEKEFVDELRKRLKRTSRTEQQTELCRRYQGNIRFAADNNEKKQQTELTAPTAWRIVIARILLGISIAAESIFFICFLNVSISDRVLLAVLTALVLVPAAEHIWNWLVRRRKHEDD